MHKIIGFNKENTTGSFYQPYNSTISEDRLFSAIRLDLDQNVTSFDNLTIEAETMIQKLTQKINIDESKKQQIYSELNQINKEIEQYHLASAGDKEIDQIAKTQKQTIKEIYKESHAQLNNLHVKCEQQINTITEVLESKQKEVAYEQQDRDESWSKIIDLFQKEIVSLEQNFKSIRNREEQIFQQHSLDLYNLQEQFQTKFDKEKSTRMREHETIIKLVSQCIENIRYIY